MSYLTFFTSSFYGEPKDTTEVLDYLEEHSGDDDKCCSLLFNEELEDTHWPSFEEDMVAFSKKFPNVLFVVCGDGEASADIWEERFLNGEIEFHQVEMPLFTKLRTPGEIKYGQQFK